MKKKALKVGITGGIGSGKTTVCKIFETLGIPVYYADLRSRLLLETDSVIHKGLRKLFGNDVFNNEGKPDREAIAARVFSDPHQLEGLNKLIHPRVGQDWQDWYLERSQTSPYLLKEAALFFETGSYRQMDKMVCVSAPEVIRVNRVMDRDKVKREEVEARMRNQLSQEIKMSLSDFIILNDGSLSLVKQVVSLHHRLIQITKKESAALTK